MQQYAMLSTLANFLTEAIEREMPNLHAIAEEQSTVRRGEGKWCPKEELGHLIDWASNNHIRFVRATLDASFAVRAIWPTTGYGCTVIATCLGKAS